MSDKLLFNLYELKNKGRIKYCYRMNQVTNTFLNRPYKPAYRKYCGRKVLNGEGTNLLISSLIESGKPFWVGRFGATEFSVIYALMRNMLLDKNENLEKKIDSLCNNAGFFPRDFFWVEKYVQLILDYCSEMDAHGIWPLEMEDFFISKYEKKAKLFQYVYLEPWALQRNDAGVLPWSHSLNGRKVLVIHPFAETIMFQYTNKREKIFANKYNSVDILPEFELKTLKAVQTIANNKDERFETWFDALNWMVEECKKIDFDVAILGCGAYGFLLAAEIKKMGKGAIQICGATQLMFGIMGKRWENNAVIKELVNDAWVYPSPAEHVTNAQMIEEACYW